MNPFKIAIILCSIFLFHAGCPSPVRPPDDKPKIKRDFVWSVDTMIFDLPGIHPPDQVYMYSIWGSSPKDVWAAGHSDIPWGRLWHYDGVGWRPARNWPINGNDGKNYIVYPFAVTGFDAQNVLVACDRGYVDDDSAMVLKWNGGVWSEIPWLDGKRAWGGLGWIVNQRNERAWAVSAAGLVVKYENGFLSTEPRFTDYRLGIYQIAALDNGDVYVNAYKDSLEGESFRGTLSNLFIRDQSAAWSLLEKKFIPDSYYDGNGLGRGAFSVGNRLFTSNAGIWVRTASSWHLLLSYQQFGGACLTSENNLWFYFRHEIWHYNGIDWAQIRIPELSNYPGSFLYGQGWSDGEEIFLSLHHSGRTYIVHGK